MSSTSPPKSPSIHVREPSTTKASLPTQSMHTLSPLSFTTPSTSARSPSVTNAAGSIPSSPTSIHSSSSAIFERDIEQPASSNPLHILHNKDPHHTARAVVHEPLENSVPSVLSAAATLLGEVDASPATGSTANLLGTTNTTTGGKEIRKGMSMDDISVIAPAPLSPQNWTASTAGSIRLGASRSPSPHLLPLPGLAAPAGAGAQQQPLTAGNRASRPAVPKRINTSGSADGDNALPTATATAAPAAGPSSVIDVVPPTPNANSFGFTASNRLTTATTSNNSGGTSPQSSPLIVTPPLPLSTGIAVARSGGATSRSTSRPTSIAMSLEELSLAPLIATTADSPVPVPPDVEPLGSAHPRPPSPNASSPSNASTNAASKRLSFISYNDLLNSTPITSFPLSSVTSGLQADAEPPHQVDTTLTVGRTRKASSRQSTMNGRSPVSDVFGGGIGIGSGGVPGARTSVFEDENLGGALSGGGGANMGIIGVGGGSASHDVVGPKGGGEWEREGFGSGLEERLEAAFKEQQVGQQQQSAATKSNSSVVGA